MGSLEVRGGGGEQGRVGKRRSKTERRGLSGRGVGLRRVQSSRGMLTVHLIKKSDSD